VPRLTIAAFGFCFWRVQETREISQGVNAGEKVISRAAELGRQGDTDGEQIWREVAREIEKTPPIGLPLSWSPQA
jgi:hypothetical protein